MDSYGEREAVRVRWLLEEIQETADAAKASVKAMVADLVKERDTFKGERDDALWKLRECEIEMDVATIKREREEARRVARDYARVLAGEAAYSDQGQEIARDRERFPWLNEQE